MFLNLFKKMIKYTENIVFFVGPTIIIINLLFRNKLYETLSIC